MIPRLPPPIGEVTIPAAFSPSGLSQAAECPLRAVLSSREVSAPRLPTHPAAERGSVFHKLLERAGKGSLPRLASVRESVEAELGLLLANARSRLAQNPDTAHFADLMVTLSEVEWHNKTKSILLAAESLLDRAPTPGSWPRSNDTAPLTYGHLPDEGTFHEVGISSGVLRLSGRMDLVEIGRPRKVRISDYKTGRVLDRQGEVLEHIALQLRLYALAVARQDPSAEIELCIIEGASNRHLGWDADIRAETEKHLEELLANLPADKECSTDELARPGPWCSNCSFRHVCARYLKSAPRVWAAGCDSGPYPLDIWGELRGRQQTAAGIALDMTDAANRNVRVQRIDPRHGPLESYVAGRRLYLFGLAATQHSQHQGKHFHPRNFFELPSDRSPVRAWSLAVFEE
jgi:RecB family exonuclease